MCICRMIKKLSSLNMFNLLFLGIKNEKFQRAMIDLCRKKNCGLSIYKPYKTNLIWKDMKYCKFTWILSKMK